LTAYTGLNTCQTTFSAVTLDCIVERLLQITGLIDAHVSDCSRLTSLHFILLNKSGKSSSWRRDHSGLLTVFACSIYTS